MGFPQQLMPLAVQDNVTFLSPAAIRAAVMDEQHCGNCSTSRKLLHGRMALQTGVNTGGGDNVNPGTQCNGQSSSCYTTTTTNNNNQPIYVFNFPPPSRFW